MPATAHHQSLPHQARTTAGNWLSLIALPPREDGKTAQIAKGGGQVSDV